MTVALFSAATTMCLVLGTASSGSAGSTTRWIVFPGFPGHGTLPAQLFRISTSGTALRQITSGVRAAEEPAFSPDGQRIAFTRVSAGIFVVEVDGSRLHRLTGDPNDRFPVWSPDGREIAFMHPVGQHLRPAIIGSNGHGQRTLRLAPEPAGRPSWTADGKSLVIATPNGSLLRVDANTGRVRRLLRPRFMRGEGTPLWSLSPNGRWIALSARRPEPPGCSGPACDVFAIFVSSVSSSRPRRLDDDGGGFPGWSPDSRRVVYATRGGIAVNEVIGGSRRLIPVDPRIVPAGDAPPAWQP